MLFIFNMTGLSRLLVAVHNPGMFISSSTNLHGLHQFLLTPRSENSDDKSFITIIDYALESSFQEILRGPDGGHHCHSDYYTKVKNNKIWTLGSTFLWLFFGTCRSLTLKYLSIFKLQKGATRITLSYKWNAICHGIGNLRTNGTVAVIYQKIMKSYQTSLMCLIALHCQSFRFV